MLSIVHAAVAYNIDGQHSILEGRHDLFQYKSLVYNRSHRNSVVTGNKSQIRQGCCTNQYRRRGDVVVERDVTLIWRLERDSSRRDLEFTIEIVMTVGLGI